jgi:hypothetical protein
MWARDPGWYFSCTITSFVHIVSSRFGHPERVAIRWNRVPTSAPHKESGMTCEGELEKCTAILLRERSVALVGGARKLPVRSDLAAPAEIHQNLRAVRAIVTD